MNHPNVETLSDHLDRALSPWRRGRVERHLRRCPACAARLAGLKSLADSVRARFAEEPAPPSLVPSVARALDLSLPTEVQKMIRRQQIRTALAATTLCAGAAALLTAVLPIIHPSPAFADVQQAMKAVRTAQWEQIEERGDSDPDGWHENSQRSLWRNYVDIGRMAKRQEFNADGYVLETAAGSLIVNGKWARRQSSGYGSPERFRQHLSSQFRQDELVSGALELGKVGDTPITRSEEVIDGVRCLRFEGTRKNPRDVSGPATIRFQFWVDPATRRVIRDRTETRGAHFFLIRTNRNYRYDQPIPESKFSWTLPPGVRWAQ